MSYRLAIVPPRHTPFWLAAGVAATGVAAAGLLPAVAALTGPLARPSTSLSAAAALKPSLVDQQIVHVLNRFAFGPRPGDIEKVKQMGVSQWLNQQLRPETIDDSAVDTKLAQLKSLQLPLSQLMGAYTGDRQLQKQNKQKRKNRQLGGVAARMEEKEPGTGLPFGTSTEAVGEMQDAKILMACDSNRQLQEMLVDFWSNHFNEDVRKGPVRSLKIADERDVIRPHIFGKFRDLLGASAHSPAMLLYLDNASSTRDMTGPAGRRAGPRRRRAALLALRANASTAPAANTATPATNSAVPAKARGRRSGLNENYAREIMELHTLGVDGGYTQKDVTEVARCFTGWSIDRKTGEFQFFPNRHDEGQKVVLGNVIEPNGGIQDGEKVLDILANHPATARHISRELCMRFISDTPSQTLVDRITAVFQATGGDLRAVMHAIAFDPELYSAASYHSKIKSPFEYAISAVRAIGGHVDLPDPSETAGRVRIMADANAAVAKGGQKAGGRGRRARTSLAQAIATMGQPLFAYEAPTGYPERSSDWVSTGGLVSRFNFALELTSGQIAEVSAAPRSLVQSAASPDGAGVANQLTNAILPGGASASTHKVVLEQARQGTSPNELVALLLAAPEFQKR